MEVKIKWIYFKDILCLRHIIAMFVPTAKMNFNVGILLMKICGLIMWDKRRKIRRIASTIYISSIKLSHLYIIALILINSPKIPNIDMFLQIFWRFVIVICNYYKLLSLNKNSNALQCEFSIPIELLRFKYEIELRVNRKLKGVVIHFCVIFVAFVITLSINGLYISTNSENIDDINQILVFNIENNILRFIYKIFHFIATIEVFLVYMSLYLLVVYLLILIDCFVEKLKIILENLDISRCVNSTNTYYINSEVVNAVVYHQYISQ
jgi:hypothetical protein